MLSPQLKTLEHARSNNYQIQPLHKSTSNLDQTKGYHIAAALRNLRENLNGEIVAGRKIGFTNRGIWPEYGIDASNWSYMYENTIFDLTEQREDLPQQQIVEVDLKHMCSLEPRIEPEIVLGLSKSPSISMDDAELLQCVDWIAHGFEVVASVFPGWRFKAADTTAAFALHGLLLLGPKQPLRSLLVDGPGNLQEQLSNFTIDLYQNDEKVDSGKGSNVLGSPVKALRHLVELLDTDKFNSPLSPGETITTGTLTKALPIRHHDVWSTKVTGIALPGVEVEFRLE